MRDVIKKEDKYYILFYQANFCQFASDDASTCEELVWAKQFKDIPDDVRDKAINQACYAVEFATIEKSSIYRSFYLVAIRPQASSCSLSNNLAKRDQSGITWIEIDLKGSRPQLLNIWMDIMDYSDKVGGWTVYPVSEDPQDRKNYTFGMANCDISGTNYWEDPLFLPPGKYYFVMTCFSEGADCAKVTFTSDDKMEIRWRPVFGSKPEAKQNYKQLMEFIQKDLEMDEDSVSAVMGPPNTLFELHGYTNMPKKVFNLLRISIHDPHFVLRPGTQLELTIDNKFYREFPENCASCFKSSKSPNPVPVYVCRMYLT